MLVLFYRRKKKQSATTPAATQKWNKVKSNIVERKKNEIV